MGSKGWVSIDRTLLDHWLWEEKPFSMGQAWVDLIALASYADGEELYRGQVVTRKRGEVHASVKWFADRWGWTRKKVRHFFDLLERDHMIRTEGQAQGPTKGTSVAIEKYAFFQDKGPTKGPTQGPHYNNINNTMHLREEYIGVDFQEQAEKELDKIRPGWREEMEKGGLS